MAKKKAGKAASGRKKTTKKAAGKRGKAGGASRTVRTPPTRVRKSTAWPAWATLFLKALKETRNPSKAALKIGKARSTAYALRAKSKKFREAWEAATFVWIDDLEECMLSRAIDGDSDPIIVQEYVQVQEGEGDKARMVSRRQTRVVPRVRYDGRLQWNLAQKLMPDKYGQKSESTGMDPHERAELIAGLVQAMLGSVPTEPNG